MSIQFAQRPVEDVEKTHQILALRTEMVRTDIATGLKRTSRGVTDTALIPLLVKGVRVYA